MLRVCICVLALLVSAPAIGRAQTCVAPDGWHKMLSENPGEIEAAVQIPVGGPPVARPFDMRLWVCGPQQIEVEAVTAVMPAHLHGMNYRPVVTRVSEHTFSVAGMFFHMPGMWRIELDTKLDVGPQNFVLDVEAK